MHKNRALFSLLLFTIASQLALSISAQQPDPDRSEPNLEITLHLIVTDDETGINDTMQSRLAPILRQLESSFGPARYRVADVQVGRMAANGVFDSKSISTISGKGQLGENPSFIEWRVGSPKRVLNGDAWTVTVESFRFGLRMPVRHRPIGVDNGGGVVNYEGLGITTSKLKFDQGVPTLVGTITLPQNGGSLFIVITVASVRQ